MATEWEQMCFYDAKPRHGGWRKCTEKTNRVLNDLASKKSNDGIPDEMKLSHGPHGAEMKYNLVLAEECKGQVVFIRATHFRLSLISYEFKVAGSETSENSWSPDTPETPSTETPAADEGSCRKRPAAAAERSPKSKPKKRPAAASAMAPPDADDVE